MERPQFTIHWVETARYLGVNPDRRLTRLPNIDQVNKKSAQKLGKLRPLLNKRICFMFMGWYIAILCQ